MLPCGTPISCVKSLEKVLPTRTLKTRSDKNSDINMGNRPRSPASNKSCKMPYFQVVSYAFSKSKKNRD